MDLRDVKSSVDVELFEWLRLRAFEERVSMAEVVRRALIEFRGAPVGKRSEVVVADDVQSVSEKVVVDRVLAGDVKAARTAGIAADLRAKLAAPSCLHQSGWVENPTLGKLCADCKTPRSSVR